MVNKNIIIVSDNYFDSIIMALEVTKKYRTVWYKRIDFNRNPTFGKCHANTQYIVLENPINKDSYKDWLFLSRYSTIIERKNIKPYLCYPKMVFLSNPRAFRKIPKNILPIFKIIKI